MKKPIWEDRWSTFDKFNIFGSATYPLGIISKVGYIFSKMSIIRILKKLKLNKNAKIIDIGCGEGRTLSYFSDFGFRNVIGIDISESAINVCKKRGFVKGKTVFVMDAKKLKFKNNSFDLVFAEGFLEHFKDFTPFVKEMARVSKKYIVITQPNHFSIGGKLLNRIIPTVQKSYVKEYDYKLHDFVDSFNNFNFKIKILYGCHFGDFGKNIDTSNIFLFEKTKAR